MGGSFPTTLQRTSDERWVTLDLVSHDERRALARVERTADLAAVVRADGGRDYDAQLRRLLASPPPDPGRQVRISWPVDLLHDLDAVAVGYLVRKITAAVSFPLSEFADPVRRAEIAPLATRHHLLRVARNVATAVAAVHHAGHGGVRARQLRLDDHARVLLVRVDELVVDAPETLLIEDRRWLGHLISGLLDGRPWAQTGELGRLLAGVHRHGSAAPTASDWFHALLDVESSLPKLGEGQAPTTATSADRAPVTAEPPEPEPPASTPEDDGPDDPTADAPTPDALLRVIRGPVGPAVPGRRVLIELPEPPAPAPPERPTRSAIRIDSAVPVPTARPRRTSPDVRGRHTHAGRTRARRRGGQDESPGRPAFAVAVGLGVGALASVAPFATFAAASVLLIVRAAVLAGRRRSTLGPHQTVAIALTRLLPFATGGVALAAFVLFDLLLLLGLAMAIAERLFEYGPGFTLTWILDLPEVPGLVRIFAFGVGLFAGLNVGGDWHDGMRQRQDGQPRMLAAPALAIASVLGVLVIDTSIVWWPFAA